MKKNLLKAVALGLSMVLVLTACGSSTGGETSSSSSSSEAESTETEETSDSTTSYDELYADSEWYSERTIEGVDLEATSDNPDKIVIKVSNQDRDFDSHPKNWGIQRYLTEIKAALGDQVEFQIYFNGSLGTSSEDVIGGLQNGTIQMATWSLGSFSGYTDAFQPFDLIYLVDSIDQGYEALCGEIGDIMREECENDCGIVPLMFGTIGMRQITNSKKTITLPEDLSGLKIRTQSNSMHIEAFSDLGASPTSIAYSELFTSLQQGVVDGQENPIANIYDQNMEEVQDYLTISDHLFTADCVCVSVEFWNSLSEEMQEVFTEAIAEGMLVAYNGILEQEERMIEELSADMEVTYLTDEQKAVWKAAAEESWDEIIENNLTDTEYIYRVIEAFQAMQ